MWQDLSLNLYKSLNSTLKVTDKMLLYVSEKTFRAADIFV